MSFQVKADHLLPVNGGKLITQKNLVLHGPHTREEKRSRGTTGKAKNHEERALQQSEERPTANPRVSQRPKVGDFIITLATSRGGRRLGTKLPAAR